MNRAFFITTIVLIAAAVGVVVYIIYQTNKPDPSKTPDYSPQQVKIPMIANLINSLPVHNTKKYSKRDLDKINKIVVHHSAANNQTAYNYAHWHVNGRGWPALGYHYVIEDNGDIVQGNALDTISYHTSGQNTSGIGICLSGDFTNRQPTQAQKESLIELVTYLRSVFEQPLEIYGHRDFKATGCPSDNVYNFIQPMKLNNLA